LTLHDVGFGLGHYYEFIRARFPSKTVHYSRSEVTPEFAAYCREHYPECQFFERDLAEKAFEDRYDYLVLAGTFYHLVDTPADEFARCAKHVISNAFAMCRRGIAFNFVTGFCEFFSDDLFYCNVEEMIHYVANNLSRFYTLDHGYPLYEYTMAVFKPEYVKRVHPEPDFAKYF
jgi:hypothetical protein